MKIAVLSDIHGNLQAFQAVLEDAKEADQIFLLGDNVNWGVHSPDVLQLIAARNLQTLKGNHETMLLDHLTGQAPVEAYTSEGFAAARFWATQLAAFKTEIEAWPCSLNLHFKGLPELFFCHGSPRNAFEEVLKQSDQALKSTLSEVSARWIFAGHNQRQQIRRLGNTTLCTVGSVGFAVDGSRTAQYAMLHGENGTWNIEFRQVPFDSNTFFASYHHSGFLQQTGIVGNIIYAGVLLGRSTIREFWQFRNRQAPEAELDQGLLGQFLMHELKPTEKQFLLHCQHSSDELKSALRGLSVLVL
ncbi:metallophosphoesterase [Deinococcus roseus]|uniref:Metallophosphoesterase n=2 Tax=Deinococcus roseus TaxID=392414 RepID=A0ABQ2CU11_9DEIO|nr:metallophosphoesterase [Deinococcus roseus]